MSFTAVAASCKLVYWRHLDMQCPLVVEYNNNKDKEKDASYIQAILK